MQTGISGISYGSARRSTKEVFMPTLAERLKGRRDELGFTQTDVSVRAKITQGQYSRYEKGTMPTGPILVAIAVALDCTTDFLLGATDEPHKSREFDSLADDEKNLVMIYRAYKRGGHLPRVAINLLKDLNVEEDTKPTIVNNQDKNGETKNGNASKRKP